MRISSALIIGVILASAVSAESKCSNQTAKNQNPQACDGLLNAPLYLREDNKWRDLKDYRGSSLYPITFAISSALNAIGAEFNRRLVDPFRYNLFNNVYEGYNIRGLPRLDRLIHLGLVFVRKAENSEDARRAVCDGLIVIISSQTPKGVRNCGPVVRWAVEQGSSTFYTPGLNRISASFISEAWIFRRR